MSIGNVSWQMYHCIIWQVVSSLNFIIFDFLITEVYSSDRFDALQKEEEDVSQCLHHPSPNSNLIIVSLMVEPVHPVDNEQSSVGEHERKIDHVGEF